MINLQNLYTDLYEKRQREYIRKEKRDYFAAKAMQGMLSNSLLEKSALELYIEKGIQPERYIKAIVKTSYEIADAMMKEREK